MTAIICDKCKETIDEPVKELVFDGVPGSPKVGIRVIFEAVNTERIDLCQSCAEMLVRNAVNYPKASKE